MPFKNPYLNFLNLVLIFLIIALPRETLFNDILFNFFFIYFLSSFLWKRCIKKFLPFSLRTAQKKKRKKCVQKRGEYQISKAEGRASGNCLYIYILNYFFILVLFSSLASPSLCAINGKKFLFLYACLLFFNTTQNLYLKKYCQEKNYSPFIMNAKKRSKIFCLVAIKRAMMENFFCCCCTYSLYHYCLIVTLSFIHPYQAAYASNLNNGFEHLKENRAEDVL